MLACWSIKGGAGVTTVAAAMAVALSSSGGGERVLLADLGGDLPRSLGIEEPSGPGLAEWLAAEAPPASGLARLEVPVADGIALLPRGLGPLHGERSAALAEALSADDRRVIVDVGTVEGPVAAELVASASRSVAVVRACPLSCHRLAEQPLVPDGVLVVRDRGRATTWRALAEAAGAPVLAELDVDPVVGRALDVGLAHRGLPRSFLAALRAAA